MRLIEVGNDVVSLDHLCVFESHTEDSCNLVLTNGDFEVFIAYEDLRNIVGKYLSVFEISDSETLVLNKITALTREGEITYIGFLGNPDLYQFKVDENVHHALLGALGEVITLSSTQDPSLERNPDSPPASSSNATIQINQSNLAFLMLWGAFITMGALILFRSL